MAESDASTSKKEMVDRMHRLHVSNLSASAHLTQNFRISALSDLTTEKVVVNKNNNKAKKIRNAVRDINFNDIDFDALQEGVYDKLNVMAEQVTIDEDDDASEYKCVLFDDKDASLIHRDFCTSENWFYRGFLEMCGIDLNDEDNDPAKWIGESKRICDFVHDRFNAIDFVSTDSDFYFYALLSRVYDITKVRPIKCDQHDFSVFSRMFVNINDDEDVFAVSYTDGVCAKDCSKCLSIYVVYVILATACLTEYAYKKTFDLDVFEQPDLKLVRNIASLLYDRSEENFYTPEDPLLGTLHSMKFNPNDDVPYTSVDSVDVFDQAVATKCVSALLSTVYPNAFELCSLTITSKNRPKVFKKLALRVPPTATTDLLDLIIMQISMQYPRIFLRLGVSTFSLSPLSAVGRNGIDGRCVPHKFKTVFKVKSLNDKLKEKSVITLMPDASCQHNMMDINIQVCGIQPKNEFIRIIKSSFARTIVHKTGFEEMIDPNNNDSRVRVKYAFPVNSNNLKENINQFYLDDSKKIPAYDRFYKAINKHNVCFTGGEVELYATIKYVLKPDNEIKVICMPKIILNNSKMAKYIKTVRTTNRLSPF